MRLMTSSECPSSTSNLTELVNNGSFQPLLVKSSFRIFTKQFEQLLLLPKQAFPLNHHHFPALNIAVVGIYNTISTTSNR